MILVTGATGNVGRHVLTLLVAGVRRVVLLSSGGVDDDAQVQDGPIATYHAEIEQALRDSGLAWTFLRPDVFAATTLMWAGQTKAGDVVRGAYAEGASAPVPRSWTTSSPPGPPPSAAPHPPPPTSRRSPVVPRAATTTGPSTTPPRSDPR